MRGRCAMEITKWAMHLLVWYAESQPTKSDLPVWVILAVHRPRDGIPDHSAFLRRNSTKRCAGLLCDLFYQSIARHILNCNSFFEICLLLFLIKYVLTNLFHFLDNYFNFFKSMCSFSQKSAFSLPKFQFFRIITLYRAISARYSLKTAPAARSWSSRTAGVLLGSSAIGSILIAPRKPTSRSARRSSGQFRLP